ncbi:MAG: pantoate--beta-alanine ligase [Rhizobiales bacterium]|nr:pantoate--beta-alanine ligase [Hyphomicrobiales bacterium]
MPEIIRTVSGMQRRSAAWRAEGLRIGLVPTMGALHEGHLDLVRRARATTDRIIVSIFVNPTQFAPTEDFAAYPRDEASDLDKLAALGVEAVFAPTVPEMYPAGYATRISVEGPARGLESDARPHFFGGVATVVAKLFIACAPDDAIFGEKDYQQLAVVRRMAADLGLPVAVVGHPTVRAEDGLALSSRNAYLSAEERAVAPTLHAALEAAAAAIRSGAAPAEALAAARDTLSTAGFDVDYVALRNAETLAEVADPAGEPLRLLAAARLGRTRLIDNIAG